MGSIRDVFLIRLDIWNILCVTINGIFLV